MIALVIILAIHLAYWMFLFSKLMFYKTESCTSNSSVDLLVCVKNEEKKIGKFLAKLKPDRLSRLLFIDDYSTDGTSKLLYNYNKVEKFTPVIDRSGKKEAVIKGIEEATADYILFTDVDCESDADWVDTMVDNACSKDIVLGYSPMKKQAGWIPLFSKYETYHTAIQYLSYAISGLTYMGVGRNMMVKKMAAEKAIPILRASKTASGDDDIMINYLATKDNVGIVLDKNSFVKTFPKSTWKDFFRQKSRHTRTATSYKLSHQLLLGLYAMSFIMFYIGIIILPLVGIITWTFALSILLFKWIIQQIINYPLMKRLDEMSLWKYFPLLDIFMFIYIIVLSFYSLIKKNDTWN